MRTGYENGYKVITLNDCVAGTSTEEHENALKYDFPMFSEPMASADLIAELRLLVADTSHAGRRGLGWDGGSKASGTVPMMVNPMLCHNLTAALVSPQR